MKNDQTNPQGRLEDWEALRPRLAGRWPTHPTAVLVVHGIGHQRPLQTLDAWARGLADVLGQAGHRVRLEHRVAAKPSTSAPKGLWFDNHIRMTVENHNAPLDLYEYYWAHCTEDQASFRNIARWLLGVVQGGATFYRENKALAEAHETGGVFFDRRGNFNPMLYFLFIYGIGSCVVCSTLLWNALRSALGTLPLAGPALTWGMDFISHAVQQGKAGRLANLLGDVVVYNTSDEKNAHYAARQKILNGAVSALTWLLEPRTNGWAYRHVMLVGHSLGSQVGFDALNRINFLLQQGALDGFRPDGTPDPARPAPGFGHVDELLSLYVTFGSPLDKIAFFLRDRAERHESVRAWMLSNFHGFKQRRWDPAEAPVDVELACGFPRLLDQVRWVNYHDAKDWVSGSLDFYHPLTNIACGFPRGGLIPFTHGDYWTSRAFHADLWSRLLDACGVPPHALHE